MKHGTVWKGPKMARISVICCIVTGSDLKEGRRYPSLAMRYRTLIRSTTLPSQPEHEQSGLGQLTLGPINSDIIIQNDVKKRALLPSSHPGLRTISRHTTTSNNLSPKGKKPGLSCTSTSCPAVIERNQNSFPWGK